MSYLGRSAKLSLKAQEKVSFLATAGQTVKTGLSYVPSFVEVYVNGVLLTDTTDFTATNGNSITFTVALLVNDEVTVISLKTFTVADHYSKTEADTLLAAKSPLASPVFTGSVGVDGNNAYTAKTRFTYGSSAPTYFSDWGYKSSSDGNKVFLTITDGGSAKDVLVADFRGNVGIGVVPEATRTSDTVLALGATSRHFVTSSNHDVRQNNARLDASGNPLYITTNPATRYQHLNTGVHTFDVAPSGSADAAISWTTTAKIKNNGAFQASKDGSYSSWGGNVDGHQFVLSDNYVALTAHSELSTMTAGVMRCLSNRGASSAYNMLTTTTGSLSDDQHRLRADGNAYADGSWNGGGADYAEYFEWTDGNSSNADRRGVSVVLVGNKIRPAVDGESPIGVISGNPSVVGDAAWSKWDSKYLTDDFNTHVLESYTITEWEVQEVNDDGDTITVKKSFETDKIPASEIAPVDATIISVDDDGNTLTRRQLNSAWNPATEYVPREDRQEWDTVGLMGKLRVIKGQPVDSRWIKMRDVSATVEEWLLR